MNMKIDDIHSIHKELIGEAVGDNKIDNMTDALKLAAGVELDKFGMSLMAESLSQFIGHYVNPEYVPFKSAVIDLILRYRIMDGAEQADLFDKIRSMFKQIFIEKYGSEGADKAEVLANIYSDQMIAVFKKNSVQANTEMYPENPTVY